jgi:hypothetical protein
VEAEIGTHMADETSQHQMPPSTGASHWQSESAEHAPQLPPSSPPETVASSFPASLLVLPLLLAPPPLDPLPLLLVLDPPPLLLDPPPLLLVEPGSFTDGGCTDEAPSPDVAQATAPQTAIADATRRDVLKIMGRYLREVFPTCPDGGQGSCVCGSSHTPPHRLVSG